MRGRLAAPGLDAWRGSFHAEHHRRGRERGQPRAGAGPRGDRLLRASREGLGERQGEPLAVHERGATHVEVTEYGTGPAWFAWERSRYDWSEPDRIRQTVIDSNAPAGRIGSAFNHLGGRRGWGWYLRQALKAVEAS